MSFITDRFLLETDSAYELYRKYAAPMPIVDYHNHLNPKLIAEDHCFSTITEAWLEGDHYKWRLLRANGVEERYITGEATNLEKFMKWAETIPFTMRNPLYHWSHLELLRYFNISELLNGKSGESIYRECNEILQDPSYSVRGLLKRMNIDTICTTDDPIDSLEWHKKIANDSFEIKVLPTWRPDKVMAVDNPIEYKEYIKQLGEVADIDISNFDDLVRALARRGQYFAEMGCKVSDHGLTTVPNVEYGAPLWSSLFAKVLEGKQLTYGESDILQGGILFHLSKMNHQMGWVQQFHVGALRNNNSRLFNLLGTDIGCDSIGDSFIAERLGRLLDRLDRENSLTKTVIYNLNPKDSEVIQSMAYNFNDGSMPGKMQYGAAWWFLDQMDGIKKHLEVLSNGGLLSRFVGMLTDSRSFLSFPRHEYFRRILCNIFGNDLERGMLPTSEFDFIGSTIENICYHNSKRYFEL